MSNRIADLLLPEFDAEMATTRNVMAAVPDGHGDWKPHAKAFPLGHLAQLVARLPGWTNMVVEQTELDLAPKTGGRTFPGYSIEPMATLLAEFDRNVVTAREAIARTSDEAFEVPWSLKRGGDVMMTMPRYGILRYMTLNHIVHHRAQLGLYLRMLDQRVPPM